MPSVIYDRILPFLQSWRVTAIRLEEKKRFISMLCRAIAIYQPQIYREILLKNLPEGIEFSMSTPEALEMAIGALFISGHLLLSLAIFQRMPCTLY